MLYLPRQVSKVPHNAVNITYYYAVWIYSVCIIANLQNSVVSNECLYYLG